MDNNYTYYNYKNCYKSIRSDDSLKQYLDTNFLSQSVDSAMDCEYLATQKGSNFFMITDLCNVTHKSTCLYPNIPKPNYGKNSNIQMILQPFKDLMNSLFGSESNRVALEKSLDTSSNLFISNNNKCLKYESDNQVYAPKNRFAIYESKSLNSNIVDIVGNVIPYDTYKSKLSTLNDYSDLIKKGVNDNNSGLLALRFKQYICNPTSNNEQMLDTEISKLNTHYQNLFENISLIASDLSSISLLTKYDNIYLEELQKDIDYGNKQLSSLLGLGGANNGKLSDTNYLKNIKFAENITIILVIIIVIIIYSKKK